MTDTQDMRQTSIDSLRELTNWLEAHPTAALPHVGIYDYQPNRERLLKQRQKLGGRWDKVEDGAFFALHRELLGGVTYQLFTGRGQVCERRVATREVVVEEPDPEARKEQR